MTHHRAHESTAETGELIPEMITPVGGKRSSDGTLQPLETDDSGNLKVSGTSTISGTISTKTDLTPSAPTSATVGATSGQIVAANVNRKGLVLINTAPNRISLGFGAAAVLDSGITLNPFGGTFVMDEFMFDTSAVNAISTSAGNNIAIQEYLT